MNAILNRIGAHFDSPPTAKPAVPKSERERGRLWSDVVFDAVLALHGQLASRSEAVVAAAANSILELERTRLRHGKNVAGSTHRTDAQEEHDEMYQLPPLSGTSRKPEVERKPKVAKPVLPPAPAKPLGNATLLKLHADEAIEVLTELAAKTPEKYRKPVTREGAEAYVLSICEEYRIGLAQIPPGEFRRISEAMIEWDCANN